MSKTAAIQELADSPGAIDDDLLTKDECCALLKIKGGHFDQLIHQKKLPFIRVSGRTVRVSRRALLRWLAGRAVSPAE